MPRASYIYVVRLSGGLVAAFTVKHELMTFLRHRTEMAPHLTEHYRVHRVRDGQAALPALFMGTARQVIDGA